jgi:hypothetical protein
MSHSQKALKNINNNINNGNSNSNSNSISIKQKNVRPSTAKNPQKVNFNLKNNHIEKFYCPQMVVTKLTKVKPIDLGSIPDLPEIPLDSLLDIQ